MADLFDQHPARIALDSFFNQPHALVAPLQKAGISRADYLTLVAGNVDHWRSEQNADGAIIDPFSKGERQYSTPAFALSAATLVVEAKRDDLLEPAVRAMTWAAHQVAIGKSADGHADFYTPMMMHTRRLLKNRVSAEQLAAWDKDLGSIEPTKAYNMGLKGMNWNLVSSSGEMLRRQDGLVPAGRRDAHAAYLRERLADHVKSFTPLGMYADPGVPMAYDAFARLWLEDADACGALDEPLGATLAASIRQDLSNGALSALLVLSPTGEWALGGRSSHHQWGEAQTVAICEINANRWQKAGRPDIAGAFKRAAHLAYQSMTRWQRPSGELYIIKNRYEPDKRFAYESYSNHSQYNLLPMAMLAMAHAHADDSIAEAPMPSEAGTYVFDARENFHKVAAAAGGYFVLFDTAGDPHYNATGLQRVQRSGVFYSPLADSATSHRGFGKDDGKSLDWSPGLQYQSADGAWHSLAEAFLADAKKPVDQQPGAVREVKLEDVQQGGGKAAFTLIWTVQGNDVGFRQRYTVDATGVHCVESLTGKAPAKTRVVLPVTAFDGVDKSTVTTNQNKTTVAFRGSTLRWTVEGGSIAPPDDVRSPAHPGLLQLLVSPRPDAAGETSWSLTLE